MSQVNNPPRAPRRASVAVEEEKAWIAFYRRLGDPAMAAELIQYLDADPALKQAHPALYLRCKHTVNRNRARQARARRIGQSVRRGLTVMVATPLAALQRMLRAGRDIVVECLPDIQAEPATTHVQRLADKPEFANDRQEFTSQAETGLAATPANRQGASEGTKAA